MEFGAPLTINTHAFSRLATGLLTCCCSRVSYTVTGSPIFLKHWRETLLSAGCGITWLMKQTDRGGSTSSQLSSLLPVLQTSSPSSSSCLQMEGSQTNVTRGFCLLLFGECRIIKFTHKVQMLKKLTFL